MRLNEERTLAILWVLLNTQTQFNDSSKAVAIMNKIEKITPLAYDMWRDSFKIIYKDETIFTWRDGCQSYGE